MIVLILTMAATTLWAAGQQPTAAAADKKYVNDPATGRVWTAPEYGGTLTWGARHHPPVIDPWYSAGWAPHFIGGVNEGLAFADWAISRDIWIGGNHRVWNAELHRGALAESWSMPDDTTFIWNIRQGVNWDDKAPVNGRELDAYDVEWNYHRYLGLGDFAEDGPSPQAGSFISLSASQAEHLVESITATDKWTVVVKLTNPILDPFSKFLGNDFFVLPREVIEKYGDAKDWRNVVGTGPLRLTDWVEGSSASWEKNPNYWVYDEKFPENRLPYIDEYRSLLMPDVSTRLAALRTGKIDMLSHLGDAYIHSIDHIESLKKTNPELEFWPFFGTAAGTFLFNQSMPLTQDVNVRKAFQMAVDRETMATSYFKGYADPAPYGMVGQFNEAGWYWPYEEWPEEVKQEYTYNPERAEELLDAAGYPRGADGYRFKIKINVFDRFEPTYGEVVMGYLDAIGIEVTDLDILTSAETGPLVAKPDTHEWALSASYYGYFAGSQFFPWVFNVMATTNLTLNPGGSATNAKDPRMDALYVAARDTTDIEELKSIWRQADEITVREHWGICKPNSPMFFVSQPWIQGYFGEAQMGQGERNTHLARIWIDSELKEAMGN